MKKVTVTQLVDFAKCEKLGVLKINRAEELGAARQRAVDEGMRSHSRLEHAASVDGRCFVATFAYGADAHQTRILRQFRDARLMPSRGGRALVRVYYAASPWLVAILARVPGGGGCARSVVDAAVRLVDRDHASQGGGA